MRFWLKKNVCPSSNSSPVAPGPRQCYASVPMALTTWSFPTTIVFGPGALSALPAHAKRLNSKRPLLVCDPGVVKAGLAARVQNVLESAGLAVAVFDKVDPEPGGVERVRRRRCVQGSPGGPHRLPRRRLAARRGQAHRAQDDPRSPAPRVRRRDRRRRAHHFERPPDHHHPDHRGHRQRSRAQRGRDARGHRAQDGHLQPVLHGQGRDPRSRAHRPDARAGDGGHRVRRAHALPRGVLLARRSPDGRRDRARRPRALREEPRPRGRAGGRPRRARRHDEGGDDGRGRVPEGARRLPLARAPALEREAPPSRALERAVPPRRRRVQRRRGPPEARAHPRHPRRRRQRLSPKGSARFARASASRAACAPRGSPSPTFRSSPRKPSRTHVTAATRSPSRRSIWPSCTRRRYDDGTFAPEPRPSQTWKRASRVLRRAVRVRLIVAARARDSCERAAGGGRTRSRRRARRSLGAQHRPGDAPQGEAGCVGGLHDVRQGRERSRSRFATPSSSEPRRSSRSRSTRPPRRGRWSSTSTSPLRGRTPGRSPAGRSSSATRRWTFPRPSSRLPPR